MTRWKDTRKRCVAMPLREDARQKNVASLRHCVKIQEKKHCVAASPREAQNRK